LAAAWQDDAARALLFAPEKVTQATLDVPAEFAGLDAFNAASADDSWLQCRPVSAQLRAWGLIQGSGAYEEWHTHRGGWLSGVYYIAIPDEFSTDDDGAGCIELGPPKSLADRYPETLRIAPRSGMLLLMPSHFHHCTIPFVSQGKRISFAFDVRPLD
jgi:hypothetical protein